jgi:tol-pal system protein YbgF
MKAAFFSAAFLAVVLPTFVVACAHGGGEEAQLAGLEVEVNRLQADRDRRDERFLHEEGGSGLAKSLPPQSARGGSPAPTARTVQLGEEGSEPPPVDGAQPQGASTLDGDDPNDTTPRPSIRVEGGPPGRRGARGVERIDETLPEDVPNGGAAGPAIRTNAPTPSALDLDARRAYDAALALVNAKQFDKALDAFAGFLVKWPDHPNADNAMYWRGECYFAKGEFARAAEEFEGTIARFPLGNKVPDAMLKLGICQQKLGNANKAKTYFDRLLRDFPRSEAARRIPGASEEKSSGARGKGPQETP